MDILIRNWTAQEAIVSLDHPLVHVFASARTPGGGWRLGIRGQEEDLCRESNLGYRLESSDPEVRRFYWAGEDAGPLNTDKTLLIRNVKLTNGHKFDALLCSAPQAKYFYSDRSVILEAFQRRIQKILKIAESETPKPIVLGAWGCGHFHNDPQMVAHVQLEAVRKSRANVVFACPDRQFISYIKDMLRVDFAEKNIRKPIV